MIVLNGELVSKDKSLIPFNNRGTFYGDGVFETLRLFKGKALFFENHYFRLMSGMRIMRMLIPESFTPEYFEKSFTDLISNTNFENTDHLRVRISVWRKEGGKYTPNSREVNFSIVMEPLGSSFENKETCEVELFKDFYIYADLLSNQKTIDKKVNILAGIFAKENSYDDMFLMNHNKMIIETISGNVFLRKDNIIKTPPLSDGCLNGIMREQVIDQLKKMINYEIVEETITPFELQRADEIFTTNVIKGIQSISKYRKKTYSRDAATELLSLLKEKLF
ncbi:aminodeoxychorismate lyase [Nonlabens tegetincola]|uniref:branched-chain-amino-acid transaminase n=1 Tax=Nonlabens tegetincola TaxID=323273 RepID=A0A090Q8N9_9FLAO|nr:aminotransferase class IV [Nonlabens tegetincola]GAK98128.1 aminodeoxychorismate lyase [Nonlabens tegetincola]